MEVSDNGKFLVDEDMSFKKISPLAEEIIVMICKRLPKIKATYYKAKVMHLEDEIGWYTNKMREQAEKITDDLRDAPMGLGGDGCIREYVRVVAGTDDRVSLSNFNSELLIPTPWSDESKNEKRAKRWREEFEWKRSLFEIDLTFGINAFDLDKGIKVMKDKMPSEAVEQGMDDHVPDEIDGAKGEQVPNHVVKKGNLEFLVCKQVANHSGDELVDKGRPLKRRKVYVE
ncbi:hypothetical protein Tco_1048293 [Tanacetum coccineum]